MGFSLPAAIAASLTTDAPVVCLTGDGGLGMCLAELETAARLGRDLRVVVFDDATLTLIAIKQVAGQGGEGPCATARSTSPRSPAASGCGPKRSPTPRRWRPPLPSPGPSLTTVRIDPSAYAAVLAATRA